MKPTVVALDLRVALRQFLADPSFPAVVVVGLGIALSTVVLLLSFLTSIVSSDRDVTARSQVARVEVRVRTPGAPQGWIAGSPLILHDHWDRAGAPIDAASRYFEADMSVKAEDRLLLQKVGFVDPELVRIFSLRAVQGNPESALAKPDAVVISRQVAMRFFSTADAVGRPLQLAGRTMTVGAVLADRAGGSSISTELLASIESPVMPEPRRLTSWLSLRGSNYVLLRSGASPSQFADIAQQYYDQSPAYKELPPAYGRQVVTFRAVPLDQLSLYGADSDGTRRLAIGLGISCLTVLLIATINCINLNAIRTIARQREIGVRKALGASPKQLTAQFLAESVLTAIVASAFGLAIAAASAPIISEWLGRSIEGFVLSPLTVGATMAVGVVVGLAAGAYPAWLANDVNAARSLAGRSTTEGPSGSVVRRALTVLQFAAAMAILGTTLTVMWQTEHVTSADPGYPAGSILVIDASVDMTDARLLALRDAISRLPGVEAVGLSWDVPGRFRRSASVEVAGANGKAMLLSLSSVGPGFFQGYGVSPLAGRVFDPEFDRQGGSQVVINARAAQQLGFRNPHDAIGQKMRAERTVFEVIGVVPDIRQRSLRDESGGVVYSIRSSSGVSVMSVRTLDVSGTGRAVASLWSTYFPDEVLRMDLARVHLERLYEADAKLGKLVGMAGAISLILAGIGLFALSEYTVRRRTREFALRRLFGAGRRDIAHLLVTEFSLVVAGGAVVGLPLSATLSAEYLSGYVDRAPVVLLSLACGLGIAVVASAVAVMGSTLRALAVAPAQALRV